MNDQPRTTPPAHPANSANAANSAHPANSANPANLADRVNPASEGEPTGEFRPKASWPFWAGAGLLASSYLLLVFLLLLADLAYPIVQGESLWRLAHAINTPEIRYSLALSLYSCTVTALLSVLVAVPLGYLLSRHDFRGKVIVDTLCDIPIVLPPLVIGLSLLILFRVPPFSLARDFFMYEVPGVILAQFLVACAFAVRTMRGTFDQISVRQEQVALTLGASAGEVFEHVVLPQAWRGVIAAGSVAWARSLGEFGPILLFAGSVRMRTEVLPTTVFLELQSAHIYSALAVSLLMIATAMGVLIGVRLLGIHTDPIQERRGPGRQIKRDR